MEKGKPDVHITQRALVTFSFQQQLGKRGRGRGGERQELKIALLFLVPDPSSDLASYLSFGAVKAPLCPLKIALFI